MDCLPILYDDECRFCRAALGAPLLWDRDRRLRPVAIQSEEGARLLAAVPENERLLSAHAVIGGKEGVLSGGAAAAPVLRLLPAGGALADLAERMPGVTDRGYRWVAANRVRLSRLVPRALKDRADVVVAQRQRAPPAGSSRS